MFDTVFELCVHGLHPRLGEGWWILLPLQIIQILLHPLKLLPGQLGRLGLLELIQPPLNGLIAHKHLIADLPSRAWNVVDFRGDQNCGSAQA